MQERTLHGHSSYGNCTSLKKQSTQAYFHFNHSLKYITGSGKAVKPLGPVFWVKKITSLSPLEKKGVKEEEGEEEKRQRKG